MDFSLREWLIVVGVIVIVGVLIDGYRRVRSGSRGRIKMSIDKNQKFVDDNRMDYFSGELPNGGARVVKRGANNDNTAGQQVSAFDVAHELRPDPLFADDDPNIAVPIFEEPIEQPIKQTIDQPSEAPLQESGTQLPVDNIQRQDAGSQEVKPQKVESQQAVKHDDALISGAPEDTQKNSAEQIPEQIPEQMQKTQPAPQKAAFQQVEEVIVMNVFSRDDSGFNGTDLMRVILACGMRFGEMDIFHREEDGAGAAIQFSMANLVKPGTFDLDAMDVFSTPGVSFFLSLPGPKNSMKAFDYMYETAQCVVKNLNGELKDEMHSAMTSQTIEHSRQKVRDFERRQLSKLR